MLAVDCRKYKNISPNGGFGKFSVASLDKFKMSSAKICLNLFVSLSPFLTNICNKFSNQWAILHTIYNKHYSTKLLHFATNEGPFVVQEKVCR